MIIAWLRIIKDFTTLPANVYLTVGTMNMVAASIFLDACPAIRTLFDAKLVELTLKVVFVLPLLASVIGVTLPALKTLYLPADFAVDFPVLFHLFAIEHIFTVFAGQVLVKVGLEVLTDFDIADLLELFLGH